MQVQDVHAAARKFPAQLDLERMPDVVMNYDPTRAVRPDPRRVRPWFGSRPDSCRSP